VGLFLEAAGVALVEPQEDGAAQGRSGVRRALAAQAGQLFGGRQVAEGGPVGPGILAALQAGEVGTEGIQASCLGHRHARGQARPRRRQQRHRSAMAQAKDGTAVGLNRRRQARAMHQSHDLDGVRRGVTRRALAAQRRQIRQRTADQGLAPQRRRQDDVALTALLTEPEDLVGLQALEAAMDVEQQGKTVPLRP